MVSSLSVWRHTCSRLMWVVERRKHVLICVAWKHVSRGRVTHPRFVWRSGDLQFPFTSYWLGVHSKKIKMGEEQEDVKPKINLNIEFEGQSLCISSSSSSAVSDFQATCASTLWQSARSKLKRPLYSGRFLMLLRCAQCPIFKWLFRTCVLIRAEL